MIMDENELALKRLELKRLQALMRDDELRKELIKINIYFRSQPVPLFRDMWVGMAIRALNTHSPDRVFSSEQAATVLDATWEVWRDYTNPLRSHPNMSFDQYVINTIKTAMGE